MSENKELEDSEGSETRRDFFRILSLPEVIRAKLTQGGEQNNPESGQRALYRRAAQHIPKIVKELKTLGFGAQEDVKPQRRPIDAAVWLRLAEGVDELNGIDRQALLVACILRELKMLP